MKQMRDRVHLKPTVGRFKCANAYIHAYDLSHLIFTVFERRLIQRWIYRIRVYFFYII